MFKKDNEQNKDTLFYGKVDERTKNVVYQGDAYTGRFMLFAVLLDIVIRGLHLSNTLISANWDLLLIVIIGALISTVYQIKNKVISSRSSALSFIVIALFAALIAFSITFFFSK